MYNSNTQKRFITKPKKGLLLDIAKEPLIVLYNKSLRTKYTQPFSDPSNVLGFYIKYNEPCGTLQNSGRIPIECIESSDGLQSFHSRYAKRFERHQTLNSLV